MAAMGTQRPAMSVPAIKVAAAGSRMFKDKGRGGGLVDIVLACYSDNQSSHPAEAYSFSIYMSLEKTENN